ncbi:MULTISPECIES: hypothetical protein [Caldilinea]|uniref:hypothetical protein n=1 Tax=Caldilinea TaxID=233191 RepID=UPI000310A93A|nr:MULTISPECIES: hypothetical protein [Caldilinea]MBO9392446.1 hypothetical protein [Caldilinea sp.]GIV71557.1 MAG: hypothetical protein KatS3mg049_0113 [Caldilinea sp.]
MFRRFFVCASPDDTDADFPQEDILDGFDDSGPSLPIILISAAAGVAGGVIGLYIPYIVLRWGLPASVFVAVFCACVGLGATGAGLTALTGDRAATVNIAMSCGLIVISFAFLGFCMVVGALVATLIVILGGR